MTPALWRALLITQFAPGTRHPSWVAPLRLLLILAGSGIAGLLFARALSRGQLPPGLNPLWTSALVALSTFILTGLALVSLQATRAHTATAAGLDRLLRVLPLRPHWRQLAQVLPNLVVAVAVLLLEAPLWLIISRQLQLSPTALAAVAILGLSAAFGLALCGWLPTPVRLLALGGVTSTGLWLLGHNHAVLVLWLLAPGVAGLAGTLRSPRHQRPPAAPWRLIGLPRAALHQWWFLLKIARNRRSLLALSFSASIATLTALAVAYRQLAPLAGAGWLLLPALLTTTVACDLRGLARRHQAPEVETLQGPAFFVRGQVRAALVVALLPPLPVVVALLGAHAVPLGALIGYTLGLQLAALLIGLLAGAIIVPQAGEAGAQLLTAASATTTLLSLPKLWHFQPLSLPAQGTAWLLIATTAYASIQIIEYVRRRAYVTV